jgi:glutathione-independent formaldehyde dehydrogenase
VCRTVSHSTDACARAHHRCTLCKAGHTGVCLNVNPARPGAAYGYVDMGGWVGGQAEYVMVPYADWNLLKFPDKDQVRVYPT